MIHLYHILQFVLLSKKCGKFTLCHQKCGTYTICSSGAKIGLDFLFFKVIRDILNGFWFKILIHLTKEQLLMLKLTHLI